MDAEQFDVVWCGAGGTGGAGGAGGAVAQRRLVRALVREGAALEQAACRACLQEAGPAGLVRLDSQIQLLDTDCAGVFYLKDILSYITRTKVEMDGVLPSGLCEKCLQDCGTAYAFLKTFELNMKALENLVDYISCRADIKTENDEPEVYLKILPLLYDYSRYDKNYYVQNIHVTNNEIKEICKLKNLSHACQVCNKMFISKQSLLRHELDICGKSTYNFCPFCTSLYIHKQSLLRHIAQKHPNEKYQLKNKLSREFTKDHTNESVRNIKLEQDKLHCTNLKTEQEIVTLKIQKAKQLRRKLNQLHEKNNNCHFCGCSYVQKKSLVRHLSQKHSHEKYLPSLHSKKKLSGSLKKEDSNESECKIKVEHDEINNASPKNDQNINVAGKIRKENELCKVKNLKTGKVYILHVCTTCNKKFKDEPTLSRHIKKCHKNYHYCQFCGFSYVRKSNLKRHIKDKHSHKKPQTSSQTKDKLSSSITNDHSNEQTITPKKRVFREYSRYCECFQHFTSKKKFQEHRRTHIDKTERFYQCAHCSFSEWNRLLFMRHIRTKHGKSKIQSKKPTIRRNIKMPSSFYECGFCGHMSLSRRFCIKHIQNHNCTYKDIQMRIIPKPTICKCKICNFTEKDLKLFNEHVLRHTRRFTCEFCGKSFHRNSRLDKHKLVHVPGKHQECDICGVRFRSIEGLTFHRRRHTGEKPYKCGVCGVSFVSSSLRGNHIKLKHNPRPMVRHQCDICNKTYRTISILRRHVRVIHMGIPWKQKEEMNKSIAE